MALSDGPSLAPGEAGQRKRRLIGVLEEQHAAIEVLIDRRRDLGILTPTEFVRRAIQEYLAFLQDDDWLALRVDELIRQRIGDAEAPKNSGVGSA